MTAIRLRVTARVFGYAAMLVAPIPVGLTFLQQAEGVTNWGPVMAVTILAMLPVLLIFVVLQRQMIKGLASGVVKG